MRTQQRHYALKKSIRTQRKAREELNKESLLNLKKLLIEANKAAAQSEVKFNKLLSKLTWEEQNKVRKREKDYVREWGERRSHTEKENMVRAVEMMREKAANWENRLKLLIRK